MGRSVAVPLGASRGHRSSVPPFLRRPPNGGRESARRDDPRTNGGRACATRTPSRDCTDRRTRRKGRAFFCAFPTPVPLLFFLETGNKKVHPSGHFVCVRSPGVIAAEERPSFFRTVLLLPSCVHSRPGRARAWDLFALDLLGYVSFEFFVVGGSSGWFGWAGAGFS